MTVSSGTSSVRRAQRMFWMLTVVALLAMGALSAALGADPGPLIGLLVIFSGTVLIMALALAARVLIAMERARPGRRPPTNGG